MKSLRSIRILLATIFFAAALALLIFRPGADSLALLSQDLQLLPSALSATLGVTAFWLCTTLLFGRIYCSTVCPIGTLQDIAVFIRAKLRLRPPFRYRHPSRHRYEILAIYIICLLLDISAVCFIIEPWNMMRNMAAIFNSNAVESTWGTLAFGSLTGIITGCITLPLLLLYAYISGRSFCTDICPIGTALGALGHRALFHIEIDPDKCTHCLKCEDKCSSGCIKVVSRYVDNSRCVRCFDCINTCSDNAIRYQINRNRRFSTPLLRKRKKA